ncbi:hypothetical protein JCM8097_009551 [Rhodosporidiobolus ruineniae]
MVPPPQRNQVGSTFPTWCGTAALDILYYPIAADHGFTATPEKLPNGDWQYGCGYEAHDHEQGYCGFRTVFHRHEERKVFVASFASTTHTCAEGRKASPTKRARQEAKAAADLLIAELKAPLRKQADKLITAVSTPVDRKKQIIRDLIPMFGAAEAKRLRQRYRGHLDEDKPLPTPASSTQRGPARPLQSAAAQVLPFPHPRSWAILPNFVADLERHSRQAAFSPILSAAVLHHQRRWTCSTRSCPWIIAVSRDEAAPLSPWRLDEGASKLEHAHSRMGLQEKQPVVMTDRHLEREPMGDGQEQQLLDRDATPSPTAREREATPSCPPPQRQKKPRVARSSSASRNDEVAFLPEPSTLTAVDTAPSASRTGPSLPPVPQTPQTPPSPPSPPEPAPKPASPAPPHAPPPTVADWLVSLVPAFASKIRTVFVPLLFDLGIDEVDELEAYTNRDDPEKGVEKLVAIMREELAVQEKKYKAPMERIEAALLEYVRRGGVKPAVGAKKEESE